MNEHETEMKRDMPSDHSCMIVGGGELDTEWARGFAAMHPHAMTIACDSGIAFFREIWECPDIFVGDYDSADPETIAYYEGKEQTLMHPLPVHKDVTDSEEALHIALRAGCDPVYLLGMTGGRIDHTLANVQILRQAAAAGVRAYLLDPLCRAWIVPAGTAGRSATAGGASAKDLPRADGGDISQYAQAQECRASLELHRDRAYGDYLSLIPVGGPVTGLTITGAEYPLCDAVLTGADSLGVSNRFADETISISFDSGELLIVEARDI